MSDQESSKINYLIEKFDTHSKHVCSELDTIKRGVYGDPENKVAGLMERQLRDEERIGKLESIKLKVIWIAIGAGLMIQALIFVIFNLEKFL